MNKINISDWKDFKVCKLFAIVSPATRSTKTYAKGNVPYVSSKSINNGVDSYLEPKSNEILEKGNCITVSPLDGSAFYQEKDFLGRGGAGSAISLLYNDSLTKYNALFICSIIKKSANKFDYNDALNSTNLANLLIKLPVQHTKTGKIIVNKESQYSEQGYVPDWGFMDKYMKNIERKAKKKVFSLKTLTGTTNQE